MISGADGLTATEAAVTVNGVSLHVRIVGEGPDVVVLHGGPGAHHDYLLPQFDTLANGRRLRYYDQRGGGRSRVAREELTELAELCIPALVIHGRHDPIPLGAAARGVGTSGGGR